MASRKSSVIDITFRANDKLSTKLTKTSKAVKQHYKVWDKSAKKIAKSGKKIEKTGKSLTKTLTVPIVAAAGAATKAFMDYESSMAEVAAYSGLDKYTEEGKAALDALSQKAIDVSSSMVYSAGDVTEAYSQMALAGYSADDMLSSIQGTMSLAGIVGGDVGETTATLVKTVSAFGDGVDSANHYADVMATLSTNTVTDVGELSYAFKNIATQAGALGYSVDEVGVALGAMAQKGISGATAGVNLSKIMTRMATNRNATKALEKMGVSMFNADGTARNLSDVFVDLRGAMGKMTDEEKAQAAFAIAGQSAQKSLLAIVNTSEGEWNGLTESIEKCGGVAESLYKTKTDTLSGKLEVLKGNVENLGIKIGEKLAPTIEKLSNWISGLVEYVSKMDDKWINVIITVAKVVAVIGPVLLVIGKILKTVPKIVNGIKLVSTALHFLSANPIILIIGAVIAVITILAIVIYKNWDKIKPVLDKVWAKTKEIFGKVLKWVVKTCIDIKNVFINVWNKAKDIFTGFVDKIKTLIAKVKEMKDKVVSFVTSIKNKITKLFTPIINKFNSIKDAVQGVIDKLGNSKLVQWLSGGNKTGGGGDVGENAKGTDYWRGGLTWVNEKGGEIMNLPRGTQIIPHDESLKQAYRMGQTSVNKSTAAQGGGTSVTIPKLADTIIVREDADIDRIAEALARKLQSVSDNYGVVA